MKLNNILGPFFEYSNICAHHWSLVELASDKVWYWRRHGAVCSKCNFSLTNEYPNIFVTAIYSRMNVRIYSVFYIFTNECPNIFVGVAYSRMIIQIYSNEKYRPNIMANNISG